ncbi:Peptidase S15 [Verrucomicrobia bacterium]|nr:Peptidase S15 [Verrucomicrobiota bacterium]
MLWSNRNLLTSLASASLVQASIAWSQDNSEVAKQLEFTRAHYTKHEYRIPMRDGVKLFTAVYAPKDRSKSYPILMQRTPYSVGPYGIDNYRATLGPSTAFEKEQFIFVFQDVRGRYLSEGQFVDVPVAKAKLNGAKDTDESSDTFDTIDWLVKNVPNNDGRVGIWGISYPGFFAAFSLIRSHPALKAVSPQAPMGDVGNGDDAYHNGAFFLAANFGFFTGFKPRGLEPERPKQGEPFDFGTPDQYEFYLRMGPLANANERYLKGQNSYWADLIKHPNYDEYWSSRALAPHMRHITPAVLFVGGWFDAEDLAGPLKLFRAADKSGTAHSLSLVMGPWRHGGWSRSEGESLGHLDFASKTGEFFREEIELPFFVRYLKDKGETNHFPKAWVFATGVDEWRKFEEWPPKNATLFSLYPGPGGKLELDNPAEQAEHSDEYVSDPAKPVPVIGEIGDGMPGDYMTYDQRFASRRTDVLSYQSEPLDKDMTIAGPVTAALRVSTSGTDSDFIVKLIDVYPDDYPNPAPNPTGVQRPGYQQLVRGEPFRGKFRHSLARPEPFVPGVPDKIEFAMPDVLHTFRVGHRIMVQIQSSWFPLIDRNPQKFLDIPSATSADYIKATEQIYRGGKNGTRVEVLMLPP